MVELSQVRRVLALGVVTASVALTAASVAAAAPPASVPDGLLATASTPDPATPSVLPTLQATAHPQPSPVQAPDPHPRNIRATTKTSKTARSSAPRSSSMAQAVSRIPGYSSHAPTTWVLASRYGHWGATDLSNGTVYINPGLPRGQLDAVVRHEWAHVLTMRVYGGNISAARVATNAAFGASGGVGLERAADCMARALGAGWTNYTSCSKATWRSHAATLLRGQRL